MRATIFRAAERRSLALAVGMALVALAGCGDDETAPVVERAELIDRIPVESESYDAVSYIDLDAAREALELPDDAGVPEADVELADEQNQLVFAAGNALPHLSAPHESPISRALDVGQVSAAASTYALFSPEAVTVAATEQPFAEIAEALENDGYERNGEVLVSEKETRVTYPAVAGEAGLVAMGGSPKAVTAALEAPSEPPSSAVRELIENLDAPLLVAITSSVDCVNAVAAAESLVGSSELILAVEGGASAAAFIADDRPIGAPSMFGEPEIDGERLNVDVTSTDAVLNSPAVTVLSGDPATDLLYDCG